MRVVIGIQNELLLELRQRNRLTDLSAFWDFAISVNERYDFFTTGHPAFTFRRVIIDAHRLLLIVSIC